jgi:hypothetical protein
MSAPVARSAFRRGLATFANAITPHEAHPFFIRPTTQKAAPIALQFYARRLRNTGVFYVPFIAGFFGWSLFGAQMLNYKNGVAGSPWKYGREQNPTAVPQL